MVDRQQALNSLLSRDFRAFLQKVFVTVSPGDTFSDNWHLGAITHLLQQIEAGDLTRLIVTQPPRSLKSITMSVAWAAWRLGQDPTCRIICVSYAQELADNLAHECKKVIESDWYRRAFPGTVLARKAEHDFTTTAGGGRFATSTGGTLTGRGGDVIIVDDPIKPADAVSDTIRAKVIDWLRSTLYTRLDDKKTGVIVMVMQRVHEEDPAGHLIENGGWHHLNLPATAEHDETIPIGRGRFHHRKAGDLLQPSREPQEVLDALRADMGSYAYSAQYQQAPVPAGGTMIEKVWLRSYDRPPERLPGDQIIQSWDCANKDGLLNDFSVCLTALVRKNEVYLLHVFRERVKFPDLRKQAVRLAEKFGAQTILIEDAANGAPLLQQLRHDAPFGMPSPTRVAPKGDKQTRMSGVTSRIEAGDLFLPKDAPWLADFVKEILGFPRHRHDDQADALSQLLGWVMRRHRTSVPVGPLVMTEHGIYGDLRGHGLEEPYRDGWDVSSHPF